MILRYLLIKEFKQLLRNTLLPIVFILLPVALMNTVPRIATQEVKGLKFAVVDNDHSSTSRRLINKIDASTYLELTAVAGTYNEAMQAMESGDADLIIEFQPHFERDLVKTGTANVMLSANATNGTKGAMAQQYVTQIIQDNEGTVVVRYLFNTRLDYKIYMVPAIFALILILIVGFLPALNIVGEKEKGTIEQINVTPIGKMEFILSKVIPYICVGIFMLAEALLAARLIYGFAPSGSLWLIFLFALVFCALVSSLGLIVSNFSSTIQQAALTMFFFLVIFIVMSGLLTPIRSMPQWAQDVTLLNPMRYFIEAMRYIYVKGSTLSQLAPQFSALLLMAVVSWAAAIASYRKSG